MSREFSQNIWKIIFQFLGKTPINANFLKFFRSLFIIHISEHIFNASLKSFLELSKFFQNFIRFLRNFSTLAVF